MDIDESIYSVFYDNGSVCNCNKSTINDLDQFGVICIVQPVFDENNKGRKHVVFNKDFYIFNGESWIVLDFMGVIDHLVNKPESIKKFLVGRTVDNATYDRILKRARFNI